MAPSYRLSTLHQNRITKKQLRVPRQLKNSRITENSGRSFLSILKIGRLISIKFNTKENPSRTSQFSMRQKRQQLLQVKSQRIENLLTWWRKRESPGGRREQRGRRVSSYLLVFLKRRLDHRPSMRKKAGTEEKSKIAVIFNQIWKLARKEGTF